MVKAVSQLLCLSGWLAIGVGICFFNAADAQASTETHCFDTYSACDGFCYTEGYSCNLELGGCKCKRYIA